MRTSSSVLHAITRSVLYALVLLLPIFFLPFTSEFFEFNKQYLLYALVILALIAWMGRSFVDRKFIFQRTPIDIPVAVFWGLIFLSSLVSKDRAISFFGSYHELTSGFIPFTFYLLLFYLVVNHMSEEAHVKKMLGYLTAGGGLAIGYFWLHRLSFIHLIPSSAAWNTVASTNGRFGMMLLIPLIAVLFLLLQKGISRRMTIAYAVLFAVHFFTIITLGYAAVFVAGTIGMMLILALAFVNLDEVRIPVASAGLAAFLMFLIFSIFGPSKLFTASLPLEVTLAHASSWQIAADTLKEGVGRALLGSGPGTFVYDFSAHRSQSFNNNIFWSLRFGSPYGQAADILATWGILGAAALIVIVAMTIWLPYRSVPRARGQKRRPLIAWGICGLVFALTVFLFFTPFGTVLWVYFFLFLGLLTVGGRLANEYDAKTMEVSFEGPPRAALVASFGSIVCIAVFCVLGMYLGRFYIAEVHFFRGAQASARQDMDKGVTELETAVALNPLHAQYQLSLTRFQFQSALQESHKDKADRNRVAQLISGAISSARRATELAPKSADAWQLLAELYVNVIPLASDAPQWAIAAYNRAIELEPSNPTFYVARGNLYRADKKIKEARQEYEHALSLKSDYGFATISLSALLEEGGDLDKAIEVAIKGAQVNRNDLAVPYNLARLYVNRGNEDDLANAERILNAILAQNSEYANALFTLGTLYEKQGKTEMALEQFRKAFKLNPDSELVKRKIEDLKSAGKK